jgi:hypothetical protein
VSIQNLFLFLIGHRQAILDLAADRRAVWVALLFVLSAGLAREYDGEDLLSEPWHLVIPLGASLGAATVLFLVACGTVFLRKEGRPPLLDAYRSFLTLFWMTAPLAWLYAIPYERFLEPGDATRANLWTLALVAAWRVALMTRVVSVLTGRKWYTSLFLVMLFADGVALLAVYYMPKPVISFMGGVRLTESEEVVQGASLLIGCLGIVSLPVWGLGAIYAWSAETPAWNAPTGPERSPRTSWGIWALAALSILIWLPILPFTQKEQWLRFQVERDLKAGRIAEALDRMSAHTPEEFPPQWDPPPRVGVQEMKPGILDVMEVILTREVAPWVRERYVAKFNSYLGDDYSLFNYPKRGSELARLIRILQGLPEGAEIAVRHERAVESRMSDPEFSPEDRDNLKALLELAKKKSDPKKNSE